MAGNDCPTKSHSDPYDEAGIMGSLSEAAEAMGMSESCKSRVNNIVENETTDTAAAMAVITPWGGGGGAMSSKHSNSKIDNSMFQEGCGSISATANAMKLEHERMTCVLNSFQATQESEIKTNVSVIFRTVAPKRALADAITIQLGRLSTIASDASTAVDNADVAADGTSISQNIIDRLADPAVLTSPTANAEVMKVAAEACQSVLKIKSDLLIRNRELANEALAFFTENNPFHAGLDGVELSQEVVARLEVQSTQTISQEVKKEVKDSMKRLAETVFTESVKDEIGPGAMQDSTKEMGLQTVRDSFIEQDTMIDETMTQNVMKVDANGSVLVEIAGPVKNLNLKQTAESNYSIVVTQCVSKAMEMGRTSAMEYINKHRTEKDSETIRRGLDDIIAAAGDANADAINATQNNLADVIKAPGEALAEAFRGAGDGFASAAGAFGGAMLIPILVVAAVLIGGFFLVTKGGPALAKATGASPGMVKIIGGVLLLILVGCLVYFWVWPKYKSSQEKRSLNKINMPAPRQRMPPINAQSLKSPYARVEQRNFKGDRSARNIPSHLKINPYYRSPTEKENTAYNVNQKAVKISTNHNPSFYFQNKKEDKPVMYTKSAYKY